MKAKSATKKRQVFEALREDILDGHYRSERFPSERTLMSRFEISRGLVREVLRELQFAGFLVVRPRSGYYVASMARNLGGLIGIIVPDADEEEVSAPISKEFIRIARRRGYGVLQGIVTGTRNQERMRQVKSLVDNCLRQHVAGVILRPVKFMGDSPKVNAGIVDAFRSAGIPIILAGYDIVPPPARSGFDLVGIDNLNAGRAVALHLVEQGAKRIAFLRRDNWDFGVRERLAGLRTVVMAMADARVIVSSLDPEDDKGVAALMSGADAPDAIICGNDALAAKLLDTLKRLGKRVPEDVMVAGFDDVRIAARTSPPLTTVHQPCASMAHSLFEMLQIRIKNINADSRTVLYHAPLVVRASTKRAK